MKRRLTIFSLAAMLISSFLPWYSNSIGETPLGMSADLFASMPIAIRIAVWSMPLVALLGIYFSARSRFSYLTALPHATATILFALVLLTFWDPRTMAARTHAAGFALLTASCLLVLMAVADFLAGIPRVVMSKEFRLFLIGLTIATVSVTLVPDALLWCNPSLGDRAPAGVDRDARRFVAKQIGLKYPWVLAEFYTYEDGGSVGGRLAGAWGSEVLFCRDGTMRAEPPDPFVPAIEPGHLYCGATYWRTEGSRVLLPDSEEYEAIALAIDAWGKAGIEPEDQERFLTIMYDSTIPGAQKYVFYRTLSRRDLKATRAMGFARELRARAEELAQSAP